MDKNKVVFPFTTNEDMLMWHTYRRDNRWVRPNKGKRKDPRIVAIVNQKGGCGKTTTAINLSACLCSLDYKVLLIDSDPQAQASLGLGLEGRRPNLHDVLTKKANITSATTPTRVKGLNIVLGDPLLSGAQIDLISCPNREFVLKEALDLHLNFFHYDFIFIDCGPTLNLVTMNVLTAARDVLIPIQTHCYALQGMKELLFTVDKVKENFNPHLSVLGILVTMFDKRSRVGYKVLQQIKEYFSDKVFDSIIRMSVAVNEAPFFHEPVNIYKQASIGAQDYLSLAEEVVARTEEVSLKYEENVRSDGR
ncbi:MAG: ParA family protein [Candidatus Omnitrophica bacterium]|nr:ParA family protein [Candidatus Omnitrophota bacterium]